MYTYLHIYKYMLHSTSAVTALAYLYRMSRMLLSPSCNYKPISLIWETTCTTSNCYLALANGGYHMGNRRDITLATAPAIGSVDVPLGSDLRQKVLRQAQIQKTMAKLTASLACIDCLETHAGLKLLERRIRHGSKLLAMSQKAQF
jgi:hypothetical protein